MGRSSPSVVAKTCSPGRVGFAISIPWHVNCSNCYNCIHCVYRDFGGKWRSRIGVRDMGRMDGRSATDELLTAAEVGGRLRLPLSTVYYLAKAGKLRGFRVGRSWRFATSEIDRIQNTRGPLVLVGLE